jgi:uncharacterized protein
MGPPQGPPLAKTVTLGVRNVEAQRAFYVALGWPLVLDSEDLVVFELRGALLALFPVEKLAADAHAEPEIGQGGIRFNIIITVDTPDEVDALAETVRRAGGRFTKPPTDAEFFVGRDAYFADPEGNYWEISCALPDNPVSTARPLRDSFDCRPRALFYAAPGHARQRRNGQSGAAVRGDDLARGCDERVTQAARVSSRMGRWGEMPA